MSATRIQSVYRNESMLLSVVVSVKLELKTKLLLWQALLILPEIDWHIWSLPERRVWMRSLSVSAERLP